ncbi:MAG TPA: tetratricopeptide repeat protein, partial [Pyrinomonadaceae bacterium]|nr:tetratricopeptide repeat protein [Pyrinomonadaceae bacterium]
YLEAHQQLGILRQKQGNLVDAEYHFRRCLEVDPGDCWSLLYLANNLAVQGHHEAVEEQYRAAINFHPDDPTAYEFFADWLDERSRSAEAASIRQRLRGLA